MGRELRRKQAKREGKNVREVQKNHKEKPLSPKTFAIIMILLVLFFIILYILTGIFVTHEIKWFSNNDNNEEVVNQVENKILAVDSLRQSEEEYYVYYYDSSKENGEITNALSSVKEKIYRVDLGDAFNSNYVGESSGIVDDINNLKVSDPTLIKVSSETIVEFYSGKDEITAALK